MARFVHAGGNIVRELFKNKVLYLMLLPVIVYFAVFHYAVMPGAYVAFVDYKLNKGIFGSDFIGLKNFEFLVQTGELWNITKNTLLYNLVFLALGNIIQIVFAIMLSEITGKWFKKISQSVILLPNFISMVIVGVFAYNLFNFNSGFINTMISGQGWTVMSSITIRASGNTLLWPSRSGRVPATV